MPRPDAGCIWTSFQSSGRRHLILTGGRGRGKSTRLEALAARLSDRALPGVFTWAQPGQAVWLRDNLTGEQAAVGRFDPSLPGPENRMRPVEEAFRTLGAGALARAAAAAGEWVSVDEVGYLETSCPAYCQALLALMERKRVLLVVRKQELPFLQELCRRPDVFCVDLDAPFGRLGCVVMASGVGRRFGGGKLLAGLWGRPLLQYALDATGGVFLRRVVVTRDPAAGISLNAAPLCLLRPAECLKTARTAQGVPCPLQKEAENRGERHLRRKNTAQRTGACEKRHISRPGQRTTYHAPGGSQAHRPVKKGKYRKPAGLRKWQPRQDSNLN